MIKAPHWKKDAKPSVNGWHHPRTGELLKSVVHTQAQVDEFMGTPKAAPPRLTEVVHHRQEQPEEGGFITEEEQKNPGFFDKVTNLLS